MKKGNWDTYRWKEIKIAMKAMGNGSVDPRHTHHSARLLKFKNKYFTPIKMQPATRSSLGAIAFLSDREVRFACFK